MHQRIEREVSYLRGFLAADQTIPAKQQEVYDRMLTLIEELGSEYHQLQHRFTELEEYVEIVDEDLDDVEQVIFEDEHLTEMICPACEEEVWIDEDDLKDPSVECLCPNCHALLITQDTAEKEIEPQEVG